MTTTYHLSNYSTLPTYQRVFYLLHSIKISSFQKCRVKWEGFFIEPTPHCSGPSPHFLVEKNTSYMVNLREIHLCKKRCHNFLSSLTICDEDRRGTDTIFYTMSTQHCLHFMTEVNSSVNLYEIFHLIQASRGYATSPRLLSILPWSIQWNNLINICHHLSKYKAIVNISENNSIFLKENALLELTLNEVVSDQSFTKKSNQL